MNGAHISIIDIETLSSSKRHRKNVERCKLPTSLNQGTFDCAEIPPHTVRRIALGAHITYYDKGSL
jgi:hypothetical protein